MCRVTVFWQALERVHNCRVGQFTQILGSLFILTVLILKANPVKDADGDGYAETFSGFSVSAGRGAVSYGSSNGNPRYTDNTSLGATSYNYFVYDGTDYSPLGYWEGVDTEVDKVFHNSKNTSLISGAGSNGFHIAGKGASAEGIVLDAKPTSDSFTVSFLIRIKERTDPSSADDRKTAQLMYIGPLDGIEEQSGYYRLVRDEGSSSNRLKGNQNMDRSDWLTDFNSVFNRDKNVRVTAHTPRSWKSRLS